MPTEPPMQPGTAEDAAPSVPTSRVRVTYFESRRPLSVSGSDDNTSDVTDQPRDVTDQLSRDVSGRQREAPEQSRVTARTGDMPTTYVVSSVDSGWENPFRPGGELSREADQIVKAIQTGRPLDGSGDEKDGGLVNGTDTALPPSPHADTPHQTAAETNGVPVVRAHAVPVQASAPPPAAVNGAAGDQESPPPGTTILAHQKPGTVEVHHSLVTPEQPGQVERVAIKKKPRARCCVVQ